MASVPWIIQEQQREEKYSVLPQAYYLEVDCEK